MINLSTHELIRSRLKLADDLVVLPKRHGDEVTYQLQSRSQGRFFSVGPGEYLFCSLLDGQTTIAEALTLSARALKSKAFTEQEAVVICRWLLDSGLAEAISVNGTAAGVAEPPKSRWSFNPFWMKIPLLAPDQLVKSLVPWLGGMFSVPAFLLMLLLWTWAGLILAGNWPEFVQSSRQLFAPENWLAMGAIWIGLKVIHEFGHALACRRAGGEVREMGLVFILLAPIAYVDVTSSWSFTSRWRRIQVAAAGMYVEFLITAIAILLWANVESTQLRFVLYNAILMSGLTTLLFNANPLMRFDGYYILSDFVGIPNLYAKAGQAWGNWLRWICFGTRTTRMKTGGWQQLLLILYGGACTAWKVLVTVSLMLATSLMFSGAGLVLSVLGTLLFLWAPAVQLAQLLAQEWQQDMWRAIRGSLLVTAVAGLLVTAIFLVPCPGTAHAPGIVEYQDLLVIRPQAAGFVERMHVVEGQLVEAGTLLAELSNEDLAVEVRDLELSVEQAQARQRRARNTGEVAVAQIEERNELALRERLNDRRARLAALMIVAPRAGRVIGQHLAELKGTYLEPGAELLALGREESKEVLVSVRQDSLEAAESTVGGIHYVRLAGTGVLPGQVERLNPRASTLAPNPALNSPFGGDLPVVIRRDSEDEEAEYQLTEPRFLLTVSLDQRNSMRVQSGQRASFQLGFGSRSIAEVTWQSLQRWVRGKLKQQG